MHLVTPDREVLPDLLTRREFPGWICPACGAWDSGSVMPRRAQWCDGACSHPKTVMVPITFAPAAEVERLRECLEAAGAKFHELDLPVYADACLRESRGAVDEGQQSDA